MEYKSVKEIALLWNISDRRVRQLCVDGKVPGAYRNGRAWLILNLMLMQYGLHPVNVKYSDRMRYYEAFDAYYGEGASDAMTAIIIEEELKELRKLLSILDM